MLTAKQITVPEKKHQDEKNYYEDFKVLIFSFGPFGGRLTNNSNLVSTMIKKELNGELITVLPNKHFRIVVEETVVDVSVLKADEAVAKVSNYDLVIALGEDQTKLRSVVRIETETDTLFAGGKQHDWTGNMLKNKTPALSIPSTASWNKNDFLVDYVYPKHQPWISGGIANWAKWWHSRAIDDKRYKAIINQVSPAISADAGNYLCEYMTYKLYISKFKAKAVFIHVGGDYGTHSYDSRKNETVIIINIIKNWLLIRETTP